MTNVSHEADGPYTCPNDKIPAILRPIERQTYEQRWCGVWYDCPQCGYSTLEMSEELMEIYKKATKAAPHQSLAENGA